MWTRRTRLGQPENVLITPRTVAGPIKDEKTKKRQKRTLKRCPGVMWADPEDHQSVVNNTPASYPILAVIIA